MKRLARASTVFLLGAIALPAPAQVVPDGSLPTEVRQAGARFDIDGGSRVGENLFHSFREFSVPTGGEAVFNNALDVANIFSRVTGGNPSAIDGWIRANGSANLFLLNPAGLLFGPNARLDLGGSFFGSTASAVRFADGVEFDATATVGAPLLTMSAPTGLQFGTGAGAIAVTGPSFPLPSPGASFDVRAVYQAAIASVGGLGVPPGQTLSLSGNGIALNGALLKAPGGRVELGSVAGPGTVRFEFPGLAFPAAALPLGDLVVDGQSLVFSSGESGGSARLWGDRLELAGGSVVAADALGRQRGEGVAIRAGVLTARSSSIVSAGSFSLDGGDAGGIAIAAGTVTVRDGAALISSTFGVGNGGPIAVTATDAVQFSGTSADGSSPSSASSSVAAGATGNAGDLSIAARSVTVRDGALLDSSTLGAGDAGTVTVTATDAAIFSGTSADGRFRSGALSTVQRGATGDAGGVSIAARSVAVRDGAQLDSSTAGLGNAGTVTVTARDTATFSGTSPDGRLASGAFSRAGFDATGNAGNVSVAAGTVELRAGASLGSDTLGFGNAGSVTVTAVDAARFSASTVSSRVSLGGRGNAGDVVIVARTVEASDGARFGSETFGNGDAGAVTVTAADMARFSAADYPDPATPQSPANQCRGRLPWRQHRDRCQRAGGFGK